MKGFALKFRVGFPLPHTPFGLFSRNEGTGPFCKSSELPEYFFSRSTDCVETVLITEFPREGNKASDVSGTFFDTWTVVERVSLSGIFDECRRFPLDFTRFGTSFWVAFGFQNSTFFDFTNMTF